MAEPETNQAEEQSEKKSSNMLMIVIISVLILIIVVGAVLAVVLMSSDESNNVQSQAPMSQDRVSPVRTKRSPSVIENSRRLSEIGILYPLDTFTVNLKSDSGRRYLKATISLELSGEELSLELDAKAPVIRDRVIRILTSKTLEEISSKKGKQKVSDQIMDTLNAIISDGNIQGIYFTEFVIQ